MVFSLKSINHKKVQIPIGRLFVWRAFKPVKKKKKKYIYIYIYIYINCNARVRLFGHLFATLSFMLHAKQSSGDCQKNFSGSRLMIASHEA